MLHNKIFIELSDHLTALVSLLEDYLKNVEKKHLLEQEILLKVDKILHLAKLVNGQVLIYSKSLLKER